MSDKKKVNKKNEPKRGKGRPTRYKPEYVEQAGKLTLLGATDVQMSDFFGVTEKTLNNWKHSHPDFLQSLKENKIFADSEVVKSLYNRALGYSHFEDKIFNDNGEPLIVPTIKHYPPDATSMIFWLKNRQPKMWREKQDIEVTGKDGGAILTKTERSSRIEELLKKKNKK